MIQGLDFFSYRYYLFDLDNTLIDETQYLFAVYRKIAEDFGIDKEEFINLFLNEGRERLFNKIIEKNNLPDAYLENFLNTLRTIKLSSRLIIFPSIFNLLTKLIVLKKVLLVITNGNVIQQMNKINQVNWNGIEENIHFILANLIKPKPSVLLFNYLKENYHLIEQETIMVGDSISDEEFAINSNIFFQNVNSFF